MAFDFQQHWQKVNELLSAGIPFVVVTMVDTRGSAPQIQGAKAVITRAGIEQGTVGGGKVEARVITHAKGILEAGAGRGCELVTWNLQTDVGMTCGGEVKFFFEVYVQNDWKISLFGAGHVAQTLIPMLLQMNCAVTCLDQRQEWLEKLATHTRLKKVCTQDLKSEVKNLDTKSFFVLMTQGHATDLPVLAEILWTIEPPYLGVIGSIQKAKVLKRNLRELGLPDNKIESFYCPMGLPLGNNTPAEISISVAAQLIQERDRLGILKHKTKDFQQIELHLGSIDK